MDLSSIIELAAGLPDLNLYHRILELSLFINSSPFLATIHPHSIADRTGLSSLSIEEFNKCVNAGILSELPRGTKPSRFTKIFLVGEPKKQRNRLVVHPELLNAEQRLHYSFNSNVAKLADERSFFRLIASHSGRGDVAIQFDLTCGFFQVPINPVIGKQYYAVKGPNGRLYYWNRMPMGLTCSPELMQCIIRILMESASAKLKDARSVSTLGYIDNILACGPPEVIEEWARHFRLLCSHAGITLNDEDVNVPHTRSAFCGRGYDLNTGTTFIPESGRAKLRDLFPAIRNRELLSLNDLASIMSTLIYCSRNTGIPLCRHFYAMKMFRKFSSVHSAHRNAPAFRCWSSATQILERWVAELLATGEVSATDLISLHETPEAILFTDATLSGFGGVLLLPDGAIHCVGHSFHDPHHRASINELELRALRYCLNYFDPILAGKVVYVGIDNTSAMHAFRSANPKSYYLGREASKIRSSAAGIFVAYITSAENPADELSRGFPLNTAKLISAASGFPCNVRHHLSWSIGWSRPHPYLDVQRQGWSGTIPTAIEMEV
jgi:hypothetical protein